MVDDEIGAFWESVGATIVSTIAGPATGILLYVECEPGVSGGYMYREDSDAIEQIDPPGEMQFDIYQHWETLDPQNRWAAVHYMIDDGRFRVKFDFLDASWVADEGEVDGLDRRLTLAVRQRFGDKPVRPSTDDDWNRLTGKTR